MEEVYFEVNITYRYEYYKSTTQGGHKSKFTISNKYLFCFCRKTKFSGK